jgi:lathosterol oxidase
VAYPMQYLLENYARLFSITIARYFIIAGVPFAIFYLSRPGHFQKQKIQERNAARNDFRREILNSLLTSVVLTFMGLMVFFTPIKKYTLAYNEVSDYPVWWIPVSVILSLVIHDSYFYWMHRILHHRRLFGIAHVEHHKSTNPSPWASYSFHFFEAWAEGLVLILLAFILPMHPIAIIAFIILGFIINVYGHLGYEITPKWFRHSFLFGIVNTSVYHNMHHSKFNSNFGLYFRFWDRLCQTEHPDYEKEYDKVQLKRFGSK